MLKLAVSARALFDMDECHSVYLAHGQAGYKDYMRKTENVPLMPGPALSFVRKMLALNTPGGPRDKVEVILVSASTHDAGVRIANSIQFHRLPIECLTFATAAPRHKYLRAMNVHLFLSTSPSAVAEAIAHGLGAAVIGTKVHSKQSDDDVIRIATDGDAALFGKESDEYFEAHGLEAFRDHEVANANTPLDGGPLKDFFMKIFSIKRDFGDEASRIRTALVTARSNPAHERVLRTLRSWDGHMDDIIFADGHTKGPLCAAFNADIYFDDASRHITSCDEHGVLAGHVPFGRGQGIANRNFVSVTT